MRTAAQIKRRPTPRELAETILAMREVEIMLMHASRDGCMFHYAMAIFSSQVCERRMPEKYLRDSAWIHKRVQAPADREYIRREFDREGESE